MAFAAGKEAKDKYFLVMVQSTMNHPWRVACTNSFLDAVKTYGDRISRFEWFNGRNDAEKELSCVEDAIALEPDLIMMTPLVAEPLTPAANLCKRAGIPLIVFDRKINAVPGKDFVTFIGASYVEEGRECARLLVEKLYQKYGEYKGNVVEIAGTAGSSPQIDRAAGFREIIQRFPGIKIVASQDGDYLRSNARSIMENYMERFPPGEIDAVFCHSDEMAIGAVAAIEAAGRDELLGWVVSTDGERPALKLIIEGKMLGTAQCPPYYGNLTIKTAIDFLDGKPVPPEIWLPFETFSNVNETELQKTKQYYEYLKANDLMY